MNVIFMGTPEFALPSLQMLLLRHSVKAVVTQPDRPKGRGKKLVPSPVKELAMKENIPVLQPEKVKEPGFIETLKAYEADIIVVVAFGQILPEAILSMPQYGCVNVHGSLLPKYRGAGPMQWAIMNGEKETGVTTMFMAKGMDTGDMLLKAALPIEAEDTYGSIGEKLSNLGAKTLKTTLELLEKGIIKATPQQEEDASYAPMIHKDLEHIDWSKSGRNIVNLIRGLNPTPGAYTLMNGESLKLWKAIAYSEEKKGVPGEITEVLKESFCIQTGEGIIEVLSVQPKGGKVMSAGAYMRGHHLEKGFIFE